MAKPKTDVTDVTLRSIADELRTYISTLERLDDDDPEREAALAALVRSIGQAKAKADSLAAFIRRTEESDIQYLKSEADRMLARAKRLEEMVDRLKGYAVDALHAMSVRRIDGHLSTIKLAKNPDTVDILDEAVVPSEWKVLTIKVRATAWEALMRSIDENLVRDFTASVEKTDVTIPKKPLLAALKAGQDVQGADLKFGKDRCEIDYAPSKPLPALTDGDAASQA